ncbi:MAG TPA: addiction module protein [Mucilaginibacter sp.]|nr:addiction module protein [Mucilaginibacter sp.]
MTTLTVNINNEQEERVLLAFLNSLKYSYKTGADPDQLSDGQKAEILRRERDFEAGKITAEPWSEVRKRFVK